MDFLGNLALSDEEQTKDSSEKVAKVGQKKLVKKPKAPKTGYRPVLVDPKCLEKEAADLGQKMLELNRSYLARELSDPDTVSWYILVYLSHRYPNKFLGSPNPIIAGTSRPSSSDYRSRLEVTNPKLESSNVTTFFDIINGYNLHCVPHSARVAMAEWYAGRYNLVLLVNKIPTSKQVLEMQAACKRCVSLINDKIDRLVLGERDPLSFLLHDLVHAYKMFSNELLMRGQVGFCRAMLRVYANQEASTRLQALLHQDEEFADAFDYLISDMNSHPKHLFFYFKAVLINAFKKRYNEKVLTGERLKEFLDLFDVFINLFGMDDATQKVARKLFIYEVDGRSVADDQDSSLDEIKLRQKKEASIFDSFFLGLASE